LKRCSVSSRSIAELAETALAFRLSWRIHALQAQGIISGYSARIDPAGWD
jgi:DNA-binding Lrp family transcriptional regulator